MLRTAISAMLLTLGLAVVTPTPAHAATDPCVGRRAGIVTPEQYAQLHAGQTWVEVKAITGYKGTAMDDPANKEGWMQRTWRVCTSNVGWLLVTFYKAPGSPMVVQYFDSRWT